MSGPVGVPRGRLVVDPSAFVAAGAVLAGDVRIGVDASVWFQCVLRGDSDRIEIGAGSNVQDLTLVHVDEGSPAIVGARVTIGHRAVIHGCRIEDDCLIGMGAVVLSGARIGAGSVIGAGAVVREGFDVPAGSLVLGVPGRIARPVDADQRAAIARGAAHYVELGRAYRALGLGQPLPASGATYLAHGSAAGSA